MPSGPTRTFVPIGCCCADLEEELLKNHVSAKGLLASEVTMGKQPRGVESACEPPLKCLHREQDEVRRQKEIKIGSALSIFG